MRLTRICATIGPATFAVRALAGLIESGMDVARLNFSHGDVEEHARVVRRIRRSAARAGRPIAVLCDLQGPRVRIGKLADPVALEEGQAVFLRTGSGANRAPGTVDLPVTYGSLHEDVKPGEPILVKDGAILLRVASARKHGVLTEVERAGVVASGAGLNAPESDLRVPALTSSDRRHLLAGLEMGVDAVALSFVRDANDVRRARRLVERAGGRALIVAKIERRQALQHLDAIVTEADGVIVARGDLGVECPVESVPLLQKDIMRRASRAGCFVMTATHMLESMIDSPTPTRAEVSDVANAVLDGVDTIMLSGETAHGRYPVEAVSQMDRIARRVERDGHEFRLRAEPVVVSDVCRSAVDLAERAAAAAVVVWSRDGRSVTAMAGHRATVPIIPLVPSRELGRALTFYRGVHARVRGSLESLVAEGLLQAGRDVVLLNPEGREETATIKVVRV